MEQPTQGQGLHEKQGKRAGAKAEQPRLHDRNKLLPAEEHLKPNGHACIPERWKARNKEVCKMTAARA